MNIKILVVLISLVFCSKSFAQSIEEAPKLKPFSIYQVGITPTYKKARAYSNLFNTGGDSFQEFTFQLNGRVNLNRTFSLGAKFSPVFNIEKETNRKEWFFMSGITLHTKTFRYARNPVLIETGIGYGNYCTCGVDIPFNHRVGYIDVGVEYMLRLNRYFFIDFNLNFYTIFTPTFTPNLPGLHSVIANPVYGVGVTYQFKESPNR